MRRSFWALLPIAFACHRDDLSDTGNVKESGFPDDSGPVGVDDTGGLLAGALVITEVMVDSSAEEGEWIELYNTSGLDFDIRYLEIKSGTESYVVDSSYLMLADSYVVLGQSSQEAVNGGAAVDLEYEGVTLDGADDLTIRWDAIVIDAVTWTAKWPHGANASMGLDPSAIDAETNDDSMWWCVAVTSFGSASFGTPGAPNDACPIDQDQDGYIVSEDCNDLDAEIHPGATEIYYDAVDQDCSGGSDWDADQDGFDTDFHVGGTDCDDTDPTIYPKAKDIPNDGIDQNCDGADEVTRIGVEDLAFGDLVVVEIMANPTEVDDTVGEWFEMVYRGAGEVDLEGLVVTDSSGETFTVAGELVMAIGESIVLGNNVDSKTNGGATVAYGYSGFTLADTDSIILSNSTIEIERIEYGDASFPDGNGASLNLDPDLFGAVMNDDGRSWCDATGTFGDGDNGSPSGNNTGCEALTPDRIEPGELVINEVMQNPSMVADASGEWFEVYNASIFELNLDGLRVSDDGGEFFRVVGTLLIPSGGFGVLGHEDDTGLNGGVTVDYAHNPAQGYSLDDGSDEIIVSNDDWVIDEVAWDNGVSFPDPAGASMGLQSAYKATADNDDGSHWCTEKAAYGDGDLGTPGGENGC